jgi:hypothetical protein
MKFKLLKEQYQFSGKGVDTFAAHVLADTMDALTNDRDPDKLIICHGGKYIEVELFAETYEELCRFLQTAYEIENEL